MSTCTTHMHTRGRITWRARARARTPSRPLQMKVVAEATITELKVRVKDRDRVLAKLRMQLEEEQASALARHTEDRAEVERLNQKLFETNERAIHGLKVWLAGVGVGRGEKGGRG